MHDAVSLLIDHWKADPHGTFNTWFLWEERLKNFRSIRRGIGQVMRDIESGTFGNVYRGSSLEAVIPERSAVTPASASTATLGNSPATSPAPITEPFVNGGAN